MLLPTHPRHVEFDLSHFKGVQHVSQSMVFQKHLPRYHGNDYLVISQSGVMAFIKASIQYLLQCVRSVICELCCFVLWTLKRAVHLLQLPCRLSPVWVCVLYYTTANLIWRKKMVKPELVIQDVRQDP